METQCGSEEPGRKNKLGDIDVVWKITINGY
jgi:hypothetical protein